ncbi:MAG: hypothetical protein IKQ71_06545 [Lachnospiraceae bacterium]|nr:hypothetical protein [Lachnospiraceae bacterium]
MSFDYKMWLDILATTIFIIFFVLSVIAVKKVIRQKDIEVPSKLGKKTGLIEVLDVNLALLAVVFLVYTHHYIYIPVIGVFAFFIMALTRLESGMSGTGIFVGISYFPYDRIDAYKLTNDDINTFQIKFRIENKWYVMRCDKKHLGTVNAIIRRSGIKSQEVISDSHQ